MADAEVLADLVVEYDELDAVVAPLPAEDWDLPTPAVGWTIRDQIQHLGFGEELAAMAARDPGAFAARLRALLDDRQGLARATSARARERSPEELLADWRRHRRDTVDALRVHGPRDRIAWVGPDMSARSFATARIMETWAHGQDVLDALGRTRWPTDRLRHIAHLGVSTRGWSFANRGRPIPEVDVRVELAAPSGGTWSWGQAECDRVCGPAQDFCLVVTQRRHVDDTALRVDGATALEWMAIAQAFAGPPMDGRRPGAFRASA